MLFKKKKQDDFDSDLGSPFDLDNNKKEGDVFGDKNNTGEDNNSNFSSGMSDMSNSLDELHSKGFHQESNTNLGGMGNMNMQQSNPTSNINNTSGSMDSKEFQVINSKLDSIKSELDALTQHVLKIERDLSPTLQNNNKKKAMW